jgi:hypothetical protein
MCLMEVPFYKKQKTTTFFINGSSVTQKKDILHLMQTPLRFATFIQNVF